MVTIQHVGSLILTSEDSVELPIRVSGLIFSRSNSGCLVSDILFGLDWNLVS